MEGLPKLALGTWLMGGTKEPDPNNDDSTDISVIRLAIDNGITLIDTAQNYANGKCEEIVGQAVSSFPRDHYQILTKQSKHNLSYQGVLEGCRSSLKRLDLEYIDYLLCHAPNQDFDLKDFFRAANELQQHGLIRHVGVSNFGPHSLEIALHSSKLPITVNQVSFSLNDDSILRTKTYDFCLKNDIPIQAFRTFAGLKENHEATAVLGSIGPKYGLSVHQTSLAYLNSYKNMHFTIRSSSTKHWDEIQKALTIKLDEEDINTLKQIHNNKSGLFDELLEL